MRVRAHGDAKRAGEPKIGQLEVVPLVDEEILRLEVAMQDPVRVAIQQPRGQLVCEFLRSRRNRHHGQIENISTRTHRLIRQ